MQRTHPDDSFERLAIAQGARRVVGVDEVGRGPLAGPVTAAAVWLDLDHMPAGLNDSKRLSGQARDALFDQIMQVADVGIGHASVAEIDQINILQASFLAMRRAVAALAHAPDHLLIDGNRLPRDLPCAAQAVVKGDAKSVSIAAASIVAKVTRDRIMADLAQMHPAYGWDQNAGYPTKRHINAIVTQGITPHHRRSFKPIRKILCPENT